MNDPGNTLIQVAAMQGLMLPLSLQAQTARQQPAALSSASQELIECTKSATLPPAVTVVRDVAYGSDPRQRFDVYAPAHAAGPGQSHRSLAGRGQSAGVCSLRRR